jgi:hypothetical protein
MTTLLSVLAMLYLLIGIGTYAATETRAVAAQMESRLCVVPYGIIQHYLFFFALFLWPLWLLVRSDGERP